MKLLNKSTLAAVGAILSWSTVATAFKLALAQTSWFALLTISVSVASLILLFVVVVQGRLSKFFTLSVRHVYRSVMLGLLNPLLYYLVLFMAYDALPSQIALPLNYTWPLAFIAIYSLMGRTRPHLLQMIGVGISFLGIVAISLYKGSHGSISSLGVGLALLSSLLWASSWIVNIRSEVDPTLQLFIGFTSAALLLNAAAFIIGVDVYCAAVPYAAYVGAAEMSIPFILWGYALKHSGNKVFINQMSYLSPILSLTLINFYLGEKLATSTIIGAALIILGIIIAQSRSGGEQKC